jgi:hypothetical protein
LASPILLRSEAIENPSKLAPYAWINGVAVTDPALQAIAISDTESVVLFETDITSGTTDIAIALQYKVSAPAAPDIFTHSAFYRVLDARSFISALDAWSRSKAVPPVDSGSVVIMPAFIELFNGATRDAATGKITLPAGPRVTTRTGRFDAVHNNRTRAGETIRLVAIFNSSTKFIQT